MSILGWDIGGANIKVATSSGVAKSFEFPLWKQPGELSAKLTQIAMQFPPHEHWAITMTGELADCYFDKAEGVRHIVAAVESARAWVASPGCAEVCGGHSPEAQAPEGGSAGSARSLATSYFTVEGELITAAEALDHPTRVAAANWRATAEWCAAEGLIREGLLVDIGSTTTDIIPITAGRPAPRGLSDTQRLMDRELVYTGVARTPICALAAELPFGESWCPVAAEFFATTADAYFLLGEASIDSTIATADGRPLDETNCIARLARCIGADSSTFTSADALRAAHYVRELQIIRIASAIKHVSSEWHCELFFCGQGEFLAAEIAECVGSHSQTLSSLLQPNDSPVSRCAPAYAVTRLAAERLERKR
jgi:(4-(4-[2-(gamma-L-glutamylamino)ethyl]phenoxymethyl)furan-2-yl)methanamine synthase